MGKFYASNQGSSSISIEQLGEDFVIKIETIGK